ncbi:MAG: tetratricopeptide repeat protein [Planctomycetes bacterium]|nr:tetratricopeptide repeat protein [Planctomycetota bacterium]
MSVDERLENARLALNEGEIRTAVGLLDSIIEDDPDQVDALRMRGHVFADYGYWHDAIKDLNKVLQANQADIESLYLRAISRASIGSHGAALTDWNSLFKILSDGGAILQSGSQPSMTDVRAGRAQTRAMLDDAVGALEDAEQAIALDPENAARYATLGDVYSADFKWLDGVKAYAKAIELDPTNASYYGLRARCLSNSGARRQAIADLEQALLVEPDAAWMVANLSQEHFTLGNFARSEELVIRALELDDGLGFAHSQLGLVLSVKGDWRRAVEEAERAVALDDDFPVLYDAACVYGRCLKLDDVEREEEFLQRAISLVDRAFENGWKDLEHTCIDESFEVIRERPEFQRLIAKWRGASN